MQFYSTLYIHAGVLAKIASQNDIVLCQNNTNIMCYVNTFTDMYHFNICDLPSKNQPSSHLVVFREIPI